MKPIQRPQPNEWSNETEKDDWRKSREEKKLLEELEG